MSEEKWRDLANELRDVLEAFMPPEGSSGWWCPRCGRKVDGHEVTFHEYHEDCGAFLGDCQPDEEWLAKARKVLAKARGRISQA